MLYERDYHILSTHEELQRQKAKKVLAHQVQYSMSDFLRYHKLMPEAAYYFESLFPNNFLHPKELDDHRRLDLASTEFLKLLEQNSSERTLLNFINGNKYYFLIGAILKHSFYFGHHATYAFKEFELPPNFVADYLLVGKNSDGYHFVFVELENSIGSIVNTDGTFGSTIRKGLKQIEDWDLWIDSNFSHLKLVFQKHLGSQMALPEEFTTLDKTRINYTIIAGRRHDFKEKTYRLQRKLKRSHNITLLHYDNLIDTVQQFKTSNNY